MPISQDPFVETPTVEHIVNPPEMASNKKSGSLLIIGAIFIFVLLLLGVAGFLFLNQQKTQTNTVQTVQLPKKVISPTPSNSKTQAIDTPSTTVEADLSAINSNLNTLDNDLTIIDSGLNDQQINLSN